MEKWKLMNKWMVMMCMAALALFASCGGDDDPVKGEDEKPEEVITEPQYRFKEPYLNWGKDKATVKSYMYGYEIIYEDDTMILFGGGETEANMAYLFEDGKLSMAAVQIDCTDEYTTWTDKEKLIKDTFKGYTITKQGYNEYYVDSKNATVGSYQQYSYEGTPYIHFTWDNCKLVSAEDYE